MKQQILSQNQLRNGRSAWRGLAWLVRAGVVLGPIVVLAVTLTACSTTPKVNTQAKTGADFTRYHTFALMPLPTTGPASDPGLMLRVAEPAHKAAVEALTAKGLTEAGREQADLAINLRGQFLPKVQVTNYGYVAGPVGLRRGAYGGVGAYQSQDVSNYEERTLTIEVFDNHTKELTWVGWSKRDATSQVDVEKLQAAIRSILSELPVGATASTH
jgi:uncharacterized protein DUF4136